MLTFKSGNPNRLLIRGLLAMAIGVATFIFPELSITVIVQSLGALLILDGIISYFTSAKKSNPSPFRIIPKGVSNIVFGIILLAFPAAMVGTFVFLIGIILMIAGASQLASQIGGRNMMGFSWVYTIIALLATLGGVVLVAKPFDSATTVLVFFGSMILLYGFGEVFWSFKMRKYQKENPVTPQSNVIDVDYEEIKDDSIES